MIRFISVFTGSIGLILLMAFIASRLARARTEGISIRLQVFFALALIVGAFSFGLGLLVLDRIEARATRLASEGAHDEASAIATFIGGQLDVTHTPLDRTVEILRSGPSRSRFRLYNLQKDLLYASGPTPNDPGTVAVSSPIVTVSGTIGFVEVVKPTIIMRSLLEDFAPTVLLISAVLGVAAAWAAMLIGREIAKPIEQLTRFAERVSEGERSLHPPIAHGAEVRRLSRAIERMRKELAGLPYVESFAADLSHELKNPVAAIRASAEVLDEGALAEPQEAERFVRRIREATAKIEALLSELLSLARIEARGIENKEQVDLAEVIRTSIESQGARSQVQLTIRPTPRVRGDRTLLTRAVDNLIGNAIHHRLGDGPILVILEMQQSNVILCVRNPGKIPPHIRKRLFRRFVTSRADRGGTGLGLPIARAVAEAHGGGVEGGELEPGTVEFRFWMPMGS